MVRNLVRFLCLGLILSLAAGCDDEASPTKAVGTQKNSAAPSPTADATSDDGDVPVAVSDLPQAVRAAVEKAVPGIVVTGAEREVEGGRLQYSVEGTAGGVRYEVEVTPDGTVVEVETGDDDDDGDGDDDDR